MKPPSQNHWGLLHSLGVMQQSTGGTKCAHGSPCWQLTVQDGTALGQSHWGLERERCQISSSLQERNRLRELSEGLKFPQEVVAGLGLESSSLNSQSKTLFNMIYVKSYEHVYICTYIHMCVHGCVKFSFVEGFISPTCSNWILTITPSDR